LESENKTGFLWSGKLAVALGTLTLAAALFYSILTPHSPTPVPASAAATEFSSERATEYLKAFAQTPHAVGSPEHEAARNTIVEQLKSLGVEPEVFKAPVPAGKDTERMKSHEVVDVVARVKGTAPTKALMLVAHYDSREGAPGAADDGSGVVALIETLRALKAGPPLKNDLIFLITDAEEVCLCGAVTFANSHPWAADVGLVLNFEARGSSGPSIMFETSDQYGWLVSEYAKTVSHPAASSLSYEVYKRLPNDTDLTVFKKAGMPGMNFAFIKDVKNYHKPTDTIENLSKRSLQHHGENALSLARHFGDLDLTDVRAPNLNYFDVLGFFVVRYSDKLIIPFIILALLIVAGVFVIGFVTGQIRIPHLAVGFLVFVAALIVIPLIIWIVAQGIFMIDRAAGFKGLVSLKTNGLVFLILASITNGVFGKVVNSFMKKFSIFNFSAAILFFWAILTTVVSVSIPGASYLFIWPLVFSGLALMSQLVMIKKGLPPVLRSIVFVVLSLPAVVMLGPTIYLMFVAMTLNANVVLTVLWVLVFGLMTPLGSCFSVTPWKGKIKAGR